VSAWTEEALAQLRSGTHSPRGSLSARNPGAPPEPCVFYPRYSIAVWYGCSLEHINCARSTGRLTAIHTGIAAREDVLIAWSNRMSGYAQWFGDDAAIRAFEEGLAATDAARRLGALEFDVPTDANSVSAPGRRVWDSKASPIVPTFVLATRAHREALLLAKRQAEALKYAKLSRRR
jgi:hypothetical protein